jgi:hypothetical protein
MPPVPPVLTEIVAALPTASSRHGFSASSPLVLASLIRFECQASKQKSRCLSSLPCALVALFSLLYSTPLLTAASLHSATADKRLLEWPGVATASRALTPSANPQRLFPERRRQVPPTAGHSIMVGPLRPHLRLPEHHCNQKYLADLSILIDEHSSAPSLVLLHPDRAPP